MSGIHKSIEHLATPLENLVHLENNPRKGNIDAIVASYREFGQVKPIVIRGGSSVHRTTTDDDSRRNS